MIRYSILKTILALLLALVYFSSCNAQNKAPNQFEALSTTNIKIGIPKIKSSLDSNKYNNVMCGLQDKNGNIWFGTSDQGVYKFDGKLFYQFTMQDGLNSNCIYSILEDKNGNIWFGTTNGICRTQEQGIISISIPSKIRPIIDNNHYYTRTSTKSTVWSIMQDSHEILWFGTGDGVYCYDGFSFSRFLADNQIINKDSVHLKMVSDIIEDKKGILWFASGMPPGYEGLCRYDGKMIERFKPKKERWIRNIVESKNGNLLLATRITGILCYDGNTFSSNSQPKDLVNGSLNAVMESNDGRLWVASDYGKYIEDTLGGLWYSNIPENNKSELIFTKISNKSVNFIFEDKDHHIWFGYRGNGLLRYDGKNIISFSEQY